MTAPALHLTRHARRYAVAYEDGAFFVMIGEAGPEAAVWPNWRGVIGDLRHRPDTNGADYRSDRMLLQYVIDSLFPSRADREVFREAGGTRRRMALEEVCRLADECRWDGSAAQILAGLQSS